MPKPMPTKEQAKALLRFSEAHHKWKEALMSHWRGGPERVLESDRHLLRQVRNQLGPTWLNKVDKKELEAASAES